MNDLFDSLGKLIASVVQVNSPFSFATVVMTMALALVFAACALRQVSKKQIYSLLTTLLALCFGLALIGLLMSYH